MEPIYFGIHQMFPREEEVQFWIAFLSVSEDQSDQFFIPVRLVPSVYRNSRDP
jgi:hypothetical protein